MFDYLIIFGRFQPPHLGHMRAVEEGLRRADRLIVLCQGIDLPRSTQRPWTFEERVEMFKVSLPPHAAPRVRFLAAADNPYRPREWAASIVGIVDSALQTDGRVLSSARIGVLGTRFDDRERIRRLFPRWQWVDVEPLRDCKGAALREAVLCRTDPGGLELDQWLSPAASEVLRATTVAPAFTDLRAEFEASEAFRAAWAAAPWPPVFVTVDAVVVACGHVLLVERAHRPGKGLWALPGGFLDSQETLAAAALQELREETSIEVDESTLRQATRRSEVFDDPARSARGRTITHAYLIELGDLGELPRVEGADDARAARWFPLEDVPRSRLFEDHYAILQAMLSIE